MPKAKEPSVNFFPFVLLVTAFLSLFAWNFTRTGSRPKAPETTQIEFPAENYLAPDFSLPDLNGKNIKLSDYRGRVVLLNFWATWCLPCEEEMPSMEKLYQRMKKESFVMLAVSIDKEGAQKVGPYLKKHGLTFPTLLDPGKEAANLYNTTGVPETFIINKSGVIVHKAVGPRDWSSRSVIEAFQKMARS